MPNSSNEAASWRRSLICFDEWLDLPDTDKVRYLARIRQEEPAFFPQLEALIRADSAAEFEHFLAASALQDVPPSDLPDAPPEVPSLQGYPLGPWTLERLIGAGGMGQVWLARRHDGLFQGEVAIKMLREPEFNRAADERFAREGQILARLAHPNIARLLDAGYSPALRQRYLVLEHVVGERVDAYCDAHRLDLAARIRIFLQICRAVSHAHANLVVHRDLKPSNVLVLPDGTVKLLDFGVAKLLEDSQGDGGFTTELTQLAGAALTPEYAAPEQVSGGLITTATDVYALGVLLYRLLSGKRPYGKTTDTPIQLVRAIVETPPARLSQLVPLMQPTSPADADSVAKLAASRATTPERLAEALRGDLEIIVAKALKKAPEERYASVQDLAGDLDRYLQLLPIKARPDSLRYRLGKFIRRRRLAVALAAAAAVALVGGVTMIVLQARFAREQEWIAERQREIAQAQAAFAEQQRQRALEQEAVAIEQRQRAQEQAALALAREKEAQAAAAEAQRFRRAAEQEAAYARESQALAQQRSELATRLAIQASDESAKATATRDFLLDIFRTNTRTQSNPVKARQTTARELLDIGAARIEQRLAGQPAVRQQMLGVLTDLYLELDELEQSKQLAQARIAVLQQLQPPPRRELAETQLALAQILLGLRDRKGGDAALSDAGKQLDALGDHQSELRARWWLERGKLTVLTDVATAGPALQKAAELFDRHPEAAPEHRHAAIMYAGIFAAQLGDWPTAIDRYRQALQFALQHQGERSYTAALSHYKLGATLTDAFGDYADGLKHLRTGLAKLAAVLGDDNAETQLLKVVVGMRLAESGRHEEGLALLTSALEIAERIEARVGKRAETDSLRRVLAEVLLLTGQFPQAGQVLAATDPKSRAANIYLREAATDLRFMVVQGRFGEARDLVDQLFTNLAKKGIDRLPKALVLHLAKVELQLAEGDTAAAETTLADAEQLAAGTLAYAPALRITAALRKAELRLAQGDAAAALAAFEAARSRLASSRQPEAYPELRAEIDAGTGGALLALGRYDSACSSLESAVAHRERISVDGSPWLARTRALLGECRIRQGRQAEALPLLLQARADYGRAGPLGPQFTSALRRAEVLLQAGMPPAQ